MAAPVTPGREEAEQRREQLAMAAADCGDLYDRVGMVDEDIRGMYRVLQERAEARERVDLGREDRPRPWWARAEIPPRFQRAAEEAREEARRLARILLPELREPAAWRIRVDLGMPR